MTPPHLTPHLTHPALDSEAPGLLSGVRVLDLSRLLPGPLCSLHLADLGADVVKVEDTIEGDYARSLGRSEEADPNEPSAFYRMVNRNKRSVALDLKQAPGRDAFMRLAVDADVVIEGFRPGVVERLGIDAPALRARNPRLVYCSITGYGQSGPYRDRAGHDINYLGYAGVLDQTGRAGEAPALSNVQMGDVLGGAATAAIAILAALYDAKRSGRGQTIDIAMTDGALAHNFFALHALSTNGHAPARGQALLTGGVPCYGIYATADGRYMAVGALEQKFWAKLCATLGCPGLADRRLATGSEGAGVRRELEALFRTETQAHWSAVFAAADCCVSPVLTLDESVEDAQIRERQMVFTAGAGALQFAPPFRFSNAPFAYRRHAPAHGEHTREVLLEAGLTEPEIAALATSGSANPGSGISVA